MSIECVKKYIDKKEYKKALKLALELYNKGNKELLLYIYISYLYHKLGNDKKIFDYLYLGLDEYPNDITIYHNLGFFHSLRGNYDKTVYYYEKAIEYGTKSIDVYMHLVSIYQKQSQYEKAKYYLFMAKKIFKDDDYINFAISLHYILLDEYIKGFDLYRSRYSKKNSKRVTTFKYLKTPKSKYVDFKDKNILIEFEQGIGDVVSFIRLLPLLKSRGVKSIFFRDTRKVLKRLLEYNYNTIAKYLGEDEKVDVNYSIPLIDLMYYLNISSRNIPYQGSYINVNRDDSNKFYKNYFIKNNRPNIGIVFRGNPKHKNDHNRSIECKEFLNGIKALFELYNIYSLQYEPTKKEKNLFEEFGVYDITHNLRDFYDTALMIDNLDLVISVDTSVFNLAGAMGKRCFVLLSYYGEVRWGVGYKQSRWYESVTQYRQKYPKQWDSVFEEIVIDTKKIL